MATKSDAVILALTSLWQSAMTTTLAGRQVVDGPQASSDASNDWLFVGSDGGAPSEFNEASNAQQSWLAFGKIKREDGFVTCAAISRTGAADVPAARAAAYATVSAAEDLLRTDPTLAGVVSLQSYLSSHNCFVAVTEKGAVARVVFTVTYQAQL